jgi:predicted DNA-binding transcriptional regulator AlpA
MAEEWTTADIARRFNVGRRTVTEKWTKRPDFPRPSLKVSRRTVRWRADDVLAWAATSAAR